MALFMDGAKNRIFDLILDKAEHVPLSTDPAFQQIFLEELRFP
jgi:hypothetical protein